MKSYFRRLIWICAILTLVFPSRAVWANSMIDVSFSYSGTPGDYLLDFKVSNNVVSASTPTSDVFLFGVLLDSEDVSHVPDGYEHFYDNWNNYNAGLSLDITYNNNWDAIGDRNRLLTNHSLSGFIVHSVRLPTSVSWFALTTNIPIVPATSPYNSSGGGATRFYPNSPDAGYTTLGFQGTASGTFIPVPEPTTLALASFGGIGCAYFAYRRRRTNNV